MVNPANLPVPRLDASILAELPEADRLQISAAIVTGAYLHCRTVDEFSNCPFDESTIAKIEQFLDESHRHRILTWDKGYRPLRIISTEGVKTSSAVKVASYINVLDRLGICYAYCIAKCIGGKLKLNDKGVLMAMPPTDDMLTSFPSGKVYKYLKNGAEDSLLGMLKAIQAQPHTLAEFDQVIETLKRVHREATGDDFPPGYSVQRWANPGGGFSRVVVLSADGAVLAEAYPA